MSFVNRILSWTLKYQYLKDPERCPKSDLTWKSSHFHFTSFFEMWMHFLRPSVMPWGSGLSWWQHLTTHSAETVCSELRDHSIFPSAPFGQLFVNSVLWYYFTLDLIFFFLMYPAVILKKNCTIRLYLQCSRAWQELLTSCCAEHRWLPSGARAHD